jgi:hypothetical protein
MFKLEKTSNRSLVENVLLQFFTSISWNVFNLAMWGIFLWQCGENY